MATTKNLLEPPRPPDGTLFIHAGTSGVRHLYPIHLTESDYNGDLFSRSICHLRSHTPTTNLCTNIEMIRNICLTIKTLKDFDISENELDNIPLDICLLIHLEILNCSNNKLINLSDLFEKLNKLKEIDLSFNQFKYLPNVIYTYKHLIRLNCEHNFIKIIDINLLNLKYLKFLILDHNQIQSFDTIDFSQLKKLEYIHIAHNQLIKFPLNLHKLTHLKNINLSYNNLTSFPIELLLINTLDVLNLSHNFLTKLSPLSDCYKRTSMIFSIDLSFNQLTKFYDYLIFISLKLDLSNNNIQIIPSNLIKKLNYNMIANRELKITNNPLIQPQIPSEILNNECPNILQIICNYFEEQQINEIIRQGFKICISGCKKSGKSSLAYCLEDHMPLIPDDKEETIVNILQFPFHFEMVNDHSLKKTVEIPKVKLPSLDMNQLKRKKPSSAPPKQSLVTSLPPTTVSHPPSVPLEPIKSLPVTIFDFNGSQEYYEHMSPFIDTNALHLICIHTADFHQTTPIDIEEVFNKNFDLTSYPIIIQLFQILQLLCEKVTEINGIMILPIATCIDLYDKRSKEDKIQALDKINKFFKFYLQSRIDQIKSEIEKINSLQTISSSLSDRLKTYNSLLHNNIQIDSCQPISSLTYQGIHELNQTIQHCILTQKTIFPHIDRILPTLWADTNRYIESLADHSPVPYLLWENFTTHIINKHGLSNLINDITMSLHHEGKILVLNEIGTKNRIVFLRPLWLGDLLSTLYDPELNCSNGCLHSDFVRSLWNNFLHKKDYFYHLWFILMRFLLIAYPKISKKELKNLFNTKDKNEIKFDYAIIPYYLPFINLNQQEEEKKKFYKQIKNYVCVCYKSSMLPLGFFHRYSVSAVLKLDINYIKHWNNFILGEHEEKKVKFIIETDHQTYINCICGTNIIEQPFDNIWNVLMLILNHFEEMFKILAPNNQFTRSIRCPYCNEYSFMGEWITPKEIQGLKIKICSLCGENIDTNYLVQPNENKRRNEELLKKIRERKANKPNDTNHLLIPPVRWFDFAQNNHTISLLYPVDFDTMVVSSNQTLSTIETNGVITPPDDLHWYPMYPGLCPPLYYVILQGVCAPLIIIISTVLNSLIGVVLLQKHLRSPTNILLLAIALYDTLTGLFPFPAYIFVFTFQRCNDYIPYNYGWFHRINHDILPFIFHTCSIWVTVVLAIQRYIYVCYSEKAKQWCTVAMALKAIAFVNILALIVAIPMFLEGTFQGTPVRSLQDPKKVFNACTVRDYSEDPRYRTLFSIYSLIRALLINVGPCTILVILNAILVMRMKEAKQNREKLIRRRSYEARAQEQTNVTLMLIIVVTIFLIVEIPMALYLIVSALLRLFKSSFLGEFLSFAVQLLNFAVLLSYPINFFIYCRMSRAFRDAFTKLLCPSFIGGREQRLQSIATPLLAKQCPTMANNDQYELNHTNIENKNMNLQINAPSSVILSGATNELVMSSLTPRNSADLNRNSTGSVEKPRVSFDDENQSTNTKLTHL